MTTTAETRRSKPASRLRGAVAAPWRAIGDWLDRPLASLHLTLAVFVLMLGMGLLMVLSASSVVAFNRSGSAFSGFTKQAVFAGVGLVAFFIMSRLPLVTIRAASVPALLLSLALLIAVLIPGIGTTYWGARSWITVSSNLQFQPSEIAKLALLLWAAHVFAANRSPSRQLRLLFFRIAPFYLTMAVLILLEPDLGTTVTLTIIFFGVMYFAGAQKWIFYVTVAAAVGGAWLLAIIEPYRMNRVTAWWSPETADPQLTYQTFQGLNALGSGGVFGNGLGQSKMKYGRLPNADSDFIFAIIGEELGLIGTLLVVALFGVLAYTGLRIARRNVDYFSKIVAGAITVWLTGQAAINILYVVGWLPVTGIPLPMFSTGGTSLVVTMTAFGMLVNLARREPQAMAALQGAGRRGISAFFGIGTGRAKGVLSARAQRRRAKRVERSRAARQRRRSAAVRPRQGERPAVGRRAASERATGRRGTDGRGGSRRDPGASERRVRGGTYGQRREPVRVGGARVSRESARRGGGSSGRAAGRQPGSAEVPRSGRQRRAGDGGAAGGQYRVRRALGFPPPQTRRSSEQYEYGGRRVR